MKNYLLIILSFFALLQTANAQHIIVTNDGYAIRTNYLEIGECNVYYQGISNSPLYLKIAKKDVMIIRLKEGEKIDPAIQQPCLSCTNQNTLIVTRQAEVIKGRNVEIGERQIFYQLEGSSSLMAIPKERVEVIKYADGRKIALDPAPNESSWTGQKVPSTPPPSTSFATTRPLEPLAPTDDEIYLDVDHDAAFPGGQAGLDRYFQQHMQYPADAWNRNISGLVYVTSVVEKNGSVSNVKLLRDIGGGCGEEALRLVLEMPRWKPAKRNGRAVRTEMNIPIEFKIEN